MNQAVQQTRKTPIIVMVGTGLETMGGISTVVKGYLAAGLFDQVPIVYIRTHRDGSLFQKLATALAGYASFIGILARRRVYLVHMHLSSRASFWRKLPIFLCTKLLRKPVLLHLHGSEFMTFYTSECGSVRKRVVEFVFDHANAVIALSPQWAENIREITDNPNIEVIFNRVPVADRQSERSDRGRPANILFLGRLGRRKGIYDLLEALVAVKNRGTEFRLVAAGDGEIAEVVAKSRQLALDPYVQVPGWVDEQGKRKLLEQADIFVLPSHAEGLPMSLLEALAAGLPVVCSSVGGIPTAVTDCSEGYIVAPGDVDALADALDRLLTNAELRAQFGRNAFERAKQDFDVRHSVGQLVALYERYRSV